MAKKPHLRVSKSPQYKVHIVSGVGLAFDGSIIRLQFFEDQVGVPDKPGMIAEVIDRIACSEVVLNIDVAQSLVSELGKFLDEITKTAKKPGREPEVA